MQARRNHSSPPRCFSGYKVRVGSRGIHFLETFETLVIFCFALVANSVLFFYKRGARNTSYSPPKKYIHAFLYYWRSVQTKECYSHYTWGPLGEGHHGRQQGTVLRVTCLLFCYLYVLSTTLAIQDIPRMPCHWAKCPALFPTLSLQSVNSSDHSLGPEVGPKVSSCLGRREPMGPVWRNCATSPSCRPWPTASSLHHSSNPHASQASSEHGSTGVCQTEVPL